MDPIYLYFDGDEQAYLRYTQMARTGERASSRDAANPVQVGLANEEGFPHPGTDGFRRQPAQSADRHHPRARGAAKQGRAVHSRACSPVCNCSAAASTARS